MKRRVAVIIAFVLMFVWFGRHRFLYTTIMFYQVRIAGLSDDYSDIIAPDLILEHSKEYLPYLINDFKSKKPKYGLYAGVYLRDIIRELNPPIDNKMSLMFKSNIESVDKDAFWEPSIEILLTLEREYALKKIQEFLNANHENYDAKSICDSLLRILALPSNRVQEIEHDICVLANSEDSGIRLGAEIYIERHSVDCSAYSSPENFK